MNAHHFDLVTRHAARVISRRASLMTLGGTAIGAALAAPAPSAARKRSGRCGKKRKKRCRREKKRCRNAVKAFCAELLDPPFNLECEAVFGPCCQSCNVGNGVICMLELATEEPITLP